MSATIQLRKRGVLTLPKSIRDKYHLEEGDALRLVDVDGVFVLTPMTPMCSWPVASRPPRTAPGRSC